MQREKPEPKVDTEPHWAAEAPRQLALPRLRGGERWAGHHCGRVRGGQAQSGVGV